MEVRSTNFLDGGGEMGALTRKLNWQNTSLGSPVEWPTILKTTLNIVLRSQFPMFLYWGEEMNCFYNDGFRQSLGDEGKHPRILGMPAQQAWPELWHIVSPMLHNVLLTGNSFLKEDQLIPIFRNGIIEDVYWTFSYSPLIDEYGKAKGILVTCIETTEKVKAFRDLEESHLQASFAIEAAELGTFDYTIQTDKFTANTRLKTWFGLPDNAEIALPLALASIVDHEREAVAAAIEQSFLPDTEGRYEIEYSLKAVHQQPERRVLAKGRVFFNEDKVALRLSGTLKDITELKRAEKKRVLDKTREQQIITREKLKAQEAERHQLGTELHDNICQILAAVKMQLESYLDEQSAKIPIIHHCVKYLDEALLETRDISHKMIMPRFAEINFTCALANLGNVYDNETRTINIIHDNELDARLSISFKETLYRITQEQMNNINKYSKATEVHIQILVDAESVGLSIRDNGVGFELASLKTGTGLGNIRHRAELLNGTVKITSAPGEGCLLEVQLPCD